MKPNECSIILCKKSAKYEWIGVYGKGIRSRFCKKHHIGWLKSLKEEGKKTVEYYKDCFEVKGVQMTLEDSHLRMARIYWSKGQNCFLVKVR